MPRIEASSSANLCRGGVDEEVRSLTHMPVLVCMHEAWARVPLLLQLELEGLPQAECRPGGLHLAECEVNLKGVEGESRGGTT